MHSHWLAILLGNMSSLNYSFAPTPAAERGHPTTCVDMVTITRDMIILGGALYLTHWMIGAHVDEIYGPTFRWFAVTGLTIRAPDITARWQVLLYSDNTTCSCIGKVFGMCFNVAVRAITWTLGWISCKPTIKSLNMNLFRWTSAVLLSTHISQYTPHFYKTYFIHHPFRERPFGLRDQDL